MNLKVNIPTFLKEKLLEYKFSVRELSKQSNIPYMTLLKIFNGNKLKPDFYTIIKLADFFQCSIDKVVGRDPKYFYCIKNINFSNKLDKTIVNQNIKNFIIAQVNKNNTTFYSLSLDIGFSSGLFSDFIREDRNIKFLSILSVCKIAEYFEVSIDEMIGRISYDSKESDDISDNKNQDPQT